MWPDPSTATGRRRVQLSATDRLSAEAEARRRWLAGQGSARNLGQIVPAYIDAREAEGIASTARQRDAWKAMQPYWQSVDPAHIDKAMCQSYARLRNRSASTVRYELNMLSVALRWAVNARLLDRAPEVWRPAPPERIQRHIDRPAFRRFLEAVRAPHARLYMVIAAATMARPTAILELQWRQVDFEHGIIDLNPPGRQQNKKRRPTVPIPDYALPTLQEAFAARTSDYVIERGGEPIKSIKKAFSAASARSGVKVTPYTLRHSGAVWRAEDDIPMAQLAQLMGHDDSRTTEKHYARFSPSFLRRAANAGAW